LSDVISEKHITFITKIILHESHQDCNKILHQQVDWMRENQSQGQPDVVADAP
jgi:hypothetical protein